MKKTLARVLLTLGLPILVVPAIAEAQAPPQVSLRSVVAGGTGCPEGAVRAVLNPERDRIFLLDGSLNASAGPGVSLAEGRTFCQVLIDLDHSPGYSYAVSSELGYRGYVELDPGVTASLQVERYFQGETSITPLDIMFRGPLGRRYFAEREPSAPVGPFSACGSPRALAIKTEVRVNAMGNPSGSGSIRLRSMWGVEVLRLHWRRCG